MASYRYNNIDPFSGICEAPLFSRSEEITRFGESFVRKSTIVLSGQIVSICQGLAESHAVARQLVSNFASNFKTFKILEGSTELLSADSVLIESIDFPDSRFAGIIPFQITIGIYDCSPGSLAVTDLRDEYSFDEKDGCIVSITHNLSCRGLNVEGLDPVDAARGFLSDRSGWNFTGNPFGYSVSSPISISKTQSINKLTGVASQTEIYSFDRSNTSGSPFYIMEYSITADERDGVVYVGAEGSIVGAEEASILDVHAYFSTINLYLICNTEYKYQFSTGENLDTAAQSFSVTDNPDSSSLSFSVSYKNSPQNDPFLIPVFTYSDSNDGVICFSADITIKSKFGCVSERLQKTSNYYKNTDWFSYVNAKFLQYGYSGNLANKPKSKGYSVDNETGDILLSLTFCNDVSDVCSDDVSNFQYTLSFSPPITQFSESPALEGEGCYYIQNLGYLSRAGFGINGSCVFSKCVSVEEGKSRVMTRVNQILVEYFSATDIILEAGNIEFSDDKTVASFSFSWSGKQAKGLSDTYIFAEF